MTHNDLSDLRARLAKCELIAFVDLQTATPLIHVGAIDIGQEHLDHLARQARVLLSGGRGSTETLAMVAQPIGTEVYLRKTARCAEGLCMLFAPDAPLDNVANGVRAALPDPDAMERA